MIVHCKELKAGDVVRRPVPGAELLDVLEVNAATRLLKVSSREDNAVFDMHWDGRTHWMVRVEAAA